MRRNVSRPGLKLLKWSYGLVPNLRCVRQQFNDGGFYKRLDRKGLKEIDLCFGALWPVPVIKRL
jgi:hypothetical protein